MIAVGAKVFKDKVYIHVKDLAYNDKIRRHLYRRFDKIPDCYKGICNLHKKDCKILEESLVFAMYLYFIEFYEEENVEEDEEEVSIKRDEVQEEKQDIDVKEEEDAIAALDLVA